MLYPEHNFSRMMIKAIRRMIIERYNAGTLIQCLKDLNLKFFSIWVIIAQVETSFLDIISEN